MMRRTVKSILLFLFMSAIGPAWAGTQGEEMNWGFLANRWQDVNGDTRLRVLGPFYERAVSTNNTRLVAFRPLFSKVRDPSRDWRLFEYLWPVGMSKKFRNQSYSRFLLSYDIDDGIQSSNHHYRFWILPVYFQGRDAHTNSYVGVFPLGGQIDEFLGRDQIHFVLFPLYMDSSVNEVKTKDILFPIYSRTEGNGIYRFRIFPFYGRSHHRDMFEKRFILWPFWTSARYNFPGSSGFGYILFPLWGHFNMENQQTWLFLPPLIRFSKGERLNYGYCPWPFIQWSSGEIEKFYIWPLWGSKRMQGYSSTFALWPIFRTERRHLGPFVSKTFLALPFVQSEIYRRRSPGGTNRVEIARRYLKIWPLFNYQREGERRRLDTLDLWPFRNAASVQRNYAPFWTFYSRTAVGDAVEDDVLWGLYHSQRKGRTMRKTSLFPIVEWSRDGQKERSWSLLKGLLAYEREGSHRQWRMLYFIHVGAKEKKP